MVGLAATGCAAAPDPEVYPLPLHEAFERLAKADTDAFRMARQCGILIHIARQAVADQSVTWRVTSSGQPIVKFTARLIPEADGKTRVAIEIPRDPKGGEPYDGDKFYPRPALHQPLRPAVRELVAAALEQRPFEVANTPNSGKHEGVCSIQRSGLEGGHPFSIHDLAAGSEQEPEPPMATDDFGAPSDDTRPASMGDDW